MNTELVMAYDTIFFQSFDFKTQVLGIFKIDYF